jgi:hypothetical protein
VENDSVDGHLVIAGHCELFVVAIFHFEFFVAGAI